MTDTDYQHRLAALPDWRRQGESIAREYTFASFAAAFDFVVKVGDLAAGLGRYPEITVRQTTVTLRLGADGAGLSAADFDAAAEFDRFH